jgi:hypothetical protein
MSADTVEGGLAVGAMSWAFRTTPAPLAQPLPRGSGSLKRNRTDALSEWPEAWRPECEPLTERGSFPSKYYLRSFSRTP